MTEATVVRDRYVKGGDRAYIHPIGRLLRRRFTTDAHFTGYVAERRLSRATLEQGVVAHMQWIIFDVDCQEVHGSRQPAPVTWRHSFNERLRKLGASHPNPFAYHTRGGARIVYGLADPFVISSRGDARKWSQDYAVALANLVRRFGITGDPACHDWTRLFRLPHATRTPAGEPECWPTLGDPYDIGVLRLDASAVDVSAARASSKAFATPRILNSAPSTSNGRGLLYHLLASRGDVLRKHGAEGACVVRCPRESEHSTGRTGDGSTLLYPPAAGCEVGAIHCMHSHCSGMTVRDWVRCFSESELADARRAARVERAA